MSYSTTVTGDGAIAYWRMDATATNAQVDQVTSNTGCNLSVTNSTGYTAAVTGLLVGDSNTAAQFTATSTYLNNASVPAKIYTPGTGSKWTMEAWIKATAFTQNGEIVRYDDGAGAGYYMRLDTTGKIEVRFNATSVISQTSATVLSTGTKYHVVCTYDGSNTVIYINGSQTDSWASSTTLSFTSGKKLVVGGNGFNNEQFNGIIDEVALYNVALTSTQVLNHYNVGTGITQVNKDFTPEWNDLVPVGKTFSPSFTDLATVGQTVTPEWAVAGVLISVGQTFSPQWTEQAAVGSVNTTRYNVSAHVGQTVTPEWNTLTKAGQTFTARFTDLTIAGKSLTPEWGVGAISYSNMIQHDNPLAYWRFGESSGTTLVDSSGNGINATFASGTVTLGQSGVTTGEDGNKAAYFVANGGATANANGAHAVSGSFSVELWVKADSVRALYLFENTSNHYFNLTFSTTGVGVAVGTGTAWLSTVGPTYTYAWSAATWYHVVVSVTPTVTTTYVNGTQVGSASYATSTPVLSPSGSTSWLIGYDSFFNPGTVAATFDEVAVYTTALSATQVANHYSAATLQYAVPVTHTFLFNDNAHVGSNFTPEWTDDAAVGRTFTPEWTDDVAVGSTLQVEYAIAPLYTHVPTSLSTVWRTDGAIVATLTAEWNTLTSVTKSLTPEWSVWTPVVTSLTPRWNDLHSVSTQAVTLKWAVYLLSINTTLTTEWNVAHLASVDTSLTVQFGVGGQLAFTLTANWQDFRDVSQALHSLWSVKQAVPTATRTFRYNTRVNLAPKLLRLVFNDDTSVRKSLTLPFQQFVATTRKLKVRYAVQDVNTVVKSLELDFQSLITTPTKRLTTRWEIALNTLGAPRYSTDFSEFPVRSAPAGWHASGMQVVQGDGTSIGGHTLTTTAQADVLGHTTYAADVVYRNDVPLASDGELVARFRVNNAYNSNTRLTWFMRWNGVAAGSGSDYGYALRNWFAASGNWGIYRVVNGAIQGSAVALPPVTIVPGQWYWVRMVTTGTGTNTQVLAYLWADGTPEPSTYFVRYVDTSTAVMTAGLAGFGVGNGSQGPVDIDWVGYKVPNASVSAPPALALGSFPVGSESTGIPIPVSGPGRASGGPFVPDVELGDAVAVSWVEFEVPEMLRLNPSMSAPPATASTAGVAPDLNVVSFISVGAPAATAAASAFSGVQAISPVSASVDASTVIGTASAGLPTPDWAFVRFDQVRAPVSTASAGGFNHTMVTEFGNSIGVPTATATAQAIRAILNGNDSVPVDMVGSATAQAPKPSVRHNYVSIHPPVATATGVAAVAIVDFGLGVPTPTAFGHASGLAPSVFLTANPSIEVTTGTASSGTQPVPRLRLGYLIYQGTAALASASGLPQDVNAVITVVNVSTAVPVTAAASARMLTPTWTFTPAELLDVIHLYLGSRTAEAKLGTVSVDAYLGTRTASLPLSRTREELKV